ncbi:Nitrite reductase NADPH [Hondaea fermentalgiana]|uniref:Nitrite reductase [NAD(P)H] n=1 Tax=Hondaea fermentalgiana TaxID=2315210 RepID=A0A2R5GLE6_9STRA|nr:Nitrite reductase NADPH [Hondaea fermentalgiana]|eukprot:GBG31700.1 Nitrite reductase NADPH [Hondaea fermentalgiana]
MAPAREKIVVVGHGMTGQRFVEKLVEHSAGLDAEQRPEIVVFGEESQPAYDRVKLTSYFEHMDPMRLHLQQREWYDDNKSQVTLRSGDRVVAIDSAKRVIKTREGDELGYDKLVLATGSVPFAPPIEGVCKDHLLAQFYGGSDGVSSCACEPEAHPKGVFVYRTIDDLDAMVKYSKEHKIKAAAVIGGGLLGLEAMRVCSEHLGVEDVRVLDSSPHLMRRQLDGKGGRQLIRTIESMGYKVHTRARTSRIEAEDGLCKKLYVGKAGAEGSFDIDVDMVILSAGIRPRDELARTAGTLTMADATGGGIQVDDHMATSDPHIFAVGECASHNGMCYGLVGPCYDMAAVLAYNLVNPSAKEEPKTFSIGDVSTKLKLMGVDVASFGDYSIEEDKENDDNALSLVFQDPLAGIYRKLTFTADGKNLRGGILVGDAEDYGTLSMLAKSTKPLKVSPTSLLPPPSANGGSGGAGVSIVDMDDDAQVCSCNDVSKGAICAAVRDQGCETVGAIGGCTKAGISCGGCKPLLQELLVDEMGKLGKTVDKSLCEHFRFTRQELFHIVQINKIKSFNELFESHGSDTASVYRGCEICRPAVASILASLWNELVISKDNAPLQDTNDRFLGNIQRGGSYSVVPRVPGGEITPAKIIALGEIAQRYGLYSKITGGQRIDLFGAERHQLPQIWEDLVNAGFESGHAYGKALRTVKSCVGSTWCRFGMRDSVGFAIELEERYRGIRSPHKLKGGVSGCIRECAEAQSKDFGLIATEQGYNLYVCGNGGSKPRHATLLASGIDEETCRRYLDRFLMFYIRTADKLQRTARWLEALEGGIDYLKEVVVNDKLGIAEELEAQMAHLIYTYKCEWKEIVTDPERRKMFAQYANEPSKSERGIEFIKQRGQQRPADWPKNWDALPHVPKPSNNPVIALEPETEESIESKDPSSSPMMSSQRFPGGETWVDMMHVDDVLMDSGVTLRYGKSELALFKLATSAKTGPKFRLFATQNMCPHRNSFVLSSGLVGDAGGLPKVACPIHKKRYILTTGKCLDDENYELWTFRTRLDPSTGRVSLLLPSEADLDEILASEKYRVTSAMKDYNPAEHTIEVETSLADGGEAKSTACCGDSKLEW